MTKKIKPETLNGFPMFTRAHQDEWEYNTKGHYHRSLIDIDRFNDHWRVYLYSSVVREFGAVGGHQPEVFDTAEQAALFCLVRGWLA